MDKLYFSIVIDASKEKVWNTMLNKDTYSKWTDVFMPGSYYEGDWSKGSKMHFLSSNEEGKMSGAVFRVKENRLYEFVSIENIGMVQDGKEDTSSEEAKVYAGALESYRFNEDDGRTEVIAELSPIMDIPEDYKEIYQGMWKKALQKLKELAEA